MAALTKGPVVLKNPLYSEDTEAMIACLQTLGFRIETQIDQIIVHDDVSCVEDKEYQLFVQDSGTTARFLLAFVCMIPGIKTIQGNRRLNERPIKDLVDALRSLNARIEYCDKEGFFPLKISTGSLSGHSVDLRSDISSQFCSAILLISPFFRHGMLLHMTTPVISKPYVAMTLKCMRDWGIEVVERERTYFIPQGQSYQKSQYVIEGDFSSAGYFFAIAVLKKSAITLENLNPFSIQADRKFLSLLSEMGNPVSYGENCIHIEGNNFIPSEMSMEDCPDQVMTMAVLAAFSKGTTKISGVRSLRVKETDRIFALKTELGKMGIQVEESHNTLTVHGGSPHEAVIDTYNDHRIAMAFAVASTYLPKMVICHPEVVKKTFPHFWDVLRSLR